MARKSEIRREALRLSLINLVKYRFDTRASEDRIQRIEDAKNEKLLEEYIGDEK